MFDVGWTEMLVIAVVMIVVVGPKDLPRMLRTFGKMAAKVRGMAGDFQKQFNEALKEAELDDVKKSVDSLRSLNPASEIKKHINPFEKAAADVRAGLQSAMAPTPKPSTASAPASPVTHEAEPLKNGATEMPGEPAPTSPAPASNGSASLQAPPPDLAAPVVGAASSSAAAAASPVQGPVAAVAQATAIQPAAAPKPASRARKAPASPAKSADAPKVAKAPAKRAASATRSTGARAKPSEKTK